MLQEFSHLMIAVSNQCSKLWTIKFVMLFIMLGYNKNLASLPMLHDTWFVAFIIKPVTTVKQVIWKSPFFLNCIGSAISPFCCFHQAAYVGIGTIQLDYCHAVSVQSPLAVICMEFKIIILCYRIVHGLAPVFQNLCHSTSLASQFALPKLVLSYIHVDWRGLATAHSLLLAPVFGMHCLCLSIQ